MTSELLARALLVLSLLLSIPRTSHSQGASFTTLPDVTVTTTAVLIKANNSFRYAMSCTNHSTTINVRYGGSDITVTRGQRLPAGGAIEIKNKGPIWMIAESSTAVVSCTEETI